MRIVNHRLENVKYEPTKKHSGEFGSSLPDTIIIHYTGGRDLNSSVDTLAKSEVKASAHVVVGKDGTIVQLVDFNLKAWHAGKSSYGGRKWFNNYAIGIEIDNPGWLNKSAEGFTTWFGEDVKPEQVVEARHRNPETNYRYWHRFNEPQIQAVQDLCRLLVKSYGIKQILGHEEVAPGRKQDPGPAFPLDKLRMNILEGDRDQLEGPEDAFPMDGLVSVATCLNIRARPDRGAEKVARSLRNNQKVTILADQDGWYRVRTEVEGWVSKSFIRTTP